MTTMGPATASGAPATAVGPRTDYPRDSRLHEIFAANAFLYPHTPAVSHHQRVFRYWELEMCARQLAGRLREAGVRPGDAVGVCGRRGPEALVAFLAILRVNAAYVPLDDDLPPARLNAMAEEAGVHVAVALPGASRRVRRLSARLDLDISTPPSPHAELPEPGIPHPGDAGAPAYIMFTSGSSGRPKPVAVTHRGVVRLVMSEPEFPAIGPRTRVLHGYNLSSDASTIEIWSALARGAELVVADRDVMVSPAALEDHLRLGNVNVAFLTTSVFHHVARTRPGAFSELDFVSAGGEAMDPDLARAVMRACPRTEVVNFYGPTENTVASTMYRVRDLPADARQVPIGRPLANSTCRVLRADGTPAVVGEAGELYVGGDGLASGYPGHPALTAERFVTAPTGDRERLYRTGDRALLRSDGMLEYLGRVDRQLKVRGQRIEPEEVEARLREYPDVGEAAVELDPGTGALHAFVTPAAGTTGIDLAELRRFCAAWLPAPAVPRTIRELAAFPVSATGKVDRARLTALRTADTADNATAEPADAPGPRVRAALHSAMDDADPADPLARVRTVVTVVWELVLGVRPGPGDDFFRIGGDSLLAAEVVNRTRAMLAVHHSHSSALVRALLAGPTVEEFTAAVAALRDAEPDTAAAPPAGLDFAAESRLGFELPPAEGPAPCPREPRAVLVTGATGFVGAHLVGTLLARTGATVHCPVRAHDTDHARQRVLAALTRYGVRAEGAEDRLVCFPGDLTRPGLGLDPDRAADLAATLDLVLHSGAQVNFIYPYTALRAANVDGTREVVRLAARRRVPVHFLSTVAVLAGFGTAGVRRVDEDLPLAHADRLTMGYAESKWVAEQLLHEAADQGLPVAVHRPYEVTGPADTGVCNTETAICSLFKMIAEVGFAPDIDLPMDFVPVDHLAEAVVHIATRHHTGRRTYHLTNPRPSGLAAVVERMRAAGFDIMTLPYDRWVLSLVLHVADNPTSPTAPFVSLCVDRGNRTDISVKEMYTAGVFPELGRANTDTALAGSGLDCPPVDTALIDRYLEYFFTSGFIRRPAACPAGRTAEDGLAHEGDAR